MSVGCHNLSQGVLVLPAGLDTLAHLIDKTLGNVLNVFLAIRHEGERPHRMSLAFGTMAVCLATAQMLLGQGTGKQIFRKLEASDQFELALTDLGRLVTFGSNLESVHLNGILQ